MACPLKPTWLSPPFFLPLPPHLERRINASLASNVLPDSPTCESSRSASLQGEERDEEWRGTKGWGRVGRGRFYSALRPELDLRSSTRMGDAELAGQSHPPLFLSSLSMPIPKRVPSSPHPVYGTYVRSLAEVCKSCTGYPLTSPCFPMCDGSKDQH